MIIKYCIFFILLNIKLINCDTNYRLNSLFKPTSYSIVITPYFDTGNDKSFTFDGEVQIKFTTSNSTSVIKIHSEDLNFTDSNISVNTANAVIQLDPSSPVTFDANYTFAYIHLQNNLQAGVDYSLKISYRGPIRSDLKGFYKNHYYEKGVKKWLGATQMEPTHARKVFPCFDEPHLKAVFTLSIDRPNGYKTSLTNTQLQISQVLLNGYTRDIFYPSPKMSTYLVAFLISELEGVQNTTNGQREFGVFTRPEALNQTTFAFNFGQRVVAALGGYLGVDYYSSDDHLRLDHVALIDFNAGAMENWGLIKYREALLLYVPETSTPHYKYRVAQIVAHETTHMWFGNLVTCHWWSDTWLNEGFANYFQDYITALIEQEVGASELLVTGSVYSAYTADEIETSNPISNINVNSPSEVSEHFGTITYQKAGSVIRMIHHLIGDNAFIYGLNVYLTSNSFNSGTPEKLYAALEQGVLAAEASIFKPSVTDIMSSWITQPGYPVLKVDINYENETIHLSQMRFYINSSHSSNELYKIPISLTTALLPNFMDTKPTFLLEERNKTIKLHKIGYNHSWVIVNIQETGLYRVNYDLHSWRLIANAIQNGEVHPLNRAKIVNDMFAFFFAEHESFDLLYELIGFLSEEKDYSVWVAAIKGFTKLRNMYIGHAFLAEIDSYIIGLTQNIVSTLGYEERPSDDFVTLRNRMQVLEFVCHLEHMECIDNAVKLFKGLKDNGVEISPSLRPLAYCNGLKKGDGTDYDFLWRRMSTTNVANEARVIGEALGCSNDEEKLKSYLFSMQEVDSPITTQDLTVPVTSILSNYDHIDVVLDSLNSNYKQWEEVHSSMDTILSSVALSLHTDEEFDKFENWLKSCEECSDQATTKAMTSLMQAKATTQWALAHQPEISKVFRNASNAFQPSIMILIVVILSSISFV